VQNEFGNINARFDGLTSRFEALGLHTNMNYRRREAHAEDDARP